MARMARIVAVGYPHHVIQRGNRRQQTFFCDDDFITYREFMAHWCAKHEVEIWAYCLMPNHVHLIAAPKKTAEGLRLAIGEAHRRYTRMINFREKWRGHLWQERFHSYPMDERHLLAAARYVEMNPVRAGIVKKPGDYAWSSAPAHLAGQDDRLVKVQPLLDLIPDWNDHVREAISEKAARTFRMHEQTGRPLGNKNFVEKLEKSLGRILHPMKPWETKTKE
jgi:putative transposase